MSKSQTPLSIIHTSKLLLLAGWIGASVLLSAVIAPGVFATLASREEAGEVVGLTLRAINISGFVIGLLLIILSLHSRRNVVQTTERGRSTLFEIILLSVVVLASGVGEWVIAAQLRALQATINRPIELLATSDPVRLQFNALHAYSVDTLGVGMIAAVIAFILLARGDKHNNQEKRT